MNAAYLAFDYLHRWAGVRIRVIRSALRSRRCHTQARLAAALAAAVMGSMACKYSGPERWVGMDRSIAACAWTPQWTLTCIAGGHRYLCIQGDAHAHTWQCAQIPYSTPAELP